MDQPQLRVLLERISHELEANALKVDRCQAAISEILPVELPAGISEQLQDLDLLSQQLGELAGVVQRLAADANDAAQSLATEVLAAVRLSDLQDRLAGRPLRAGVSSEPELW